MIAFDRATQKPVSMPLPEGAQYDLPTVSTTTYDPTTGQPVTTVQPRGSFVTGTGGQGVTSRKPLKPLPSDTQAQFQDTERAYRSLEMMRNGFSETGKIQGPISAGQASLGYNQKAIDFQTGRANFKLSAQSLVKGIPSNFDIQTVIDTLPDIMQQPEVNKSRADFVEKSLDQLLRFKIGFFKGQGYQIPDAVLGMAQARGIDVNSVQNMSRSDVARAAKEFNKRVKDFASGNTTKKGEWGIQKVTP